MPSLTTHAATITVNVSLATLARGVAGFSTVLLLVPLATNSLNGVRVVEYTSLAAAQAAQTAGYISAGTLAAVTCAFAQVPSIESIKVGYADLAGSPAETYATALTACIAYDPDFYGVCIAVRTNTEIAAVGALVETNAKKMLFVFQSADSSWLDSGIPSGLSAMAAYERSVACYFATATEWADIALACNRLNADPDVISAPWRLFDAAGLTTATTITEEQRLLAIANNCNVFAQYGDADFAPAPGYNMAGRQIEQVVSADWFATRIREKIEAIKLTRSNEFKKIPIDLAGQAIIEAGLKELAAQAIAAGHFEEVVITPEDLTSRTVLAAAIAAQRLTFRIDAQTVTDAWQFTVNAYANTLPVS